MTEQWFRFYVGALDDVKVQSMPGEMFKSWVNILCLAKRNDGLIRPDDVAFALRVPQAKADNILSVLKKKGLLDESGDNLVPHNWDARQYKSDVSTPRVKRFRERQRNGHGNAYSNVTGNRDGPLPETPPEQNRTEQMRACARDGSFGGVRMGSPAKVAKW
jgi:hypothetical protein